MKSGKSFNHIFTVLMVVAGGFAGWMQNHQLIFKSRVPGLPGSLIVQYRLKLNNGLLVVYAKDSQLIKYALGAKLYEGGCKNQFNPVTWIDKRNIQISCGIEKSSYLIETPDGKITVNIK